MSMNGAALRCALSNWTGITRLVVAGVGLGLAGCPAPAPLYFNETADVLHRGQVSIGAVGGVGAQVTRDNFNRDPGVKVPPTMGGGGVRVRFGVGHGQEVGVDTLVAGVGGDAPDLSASGKLAWKVSVAPPAALLLGLGLAYRRMDLGALGVANSLSPGADLGLVFSPSRPWLVKPYLGLRTGLFAGFVGYDQPSFKLSDGTFGLFTPQAALGLSVGALRWLRLSVEAGYVGALYFKATGSKDVASNGDNYTYSHQVYGSLGLTFVMGE